MVDFDSLSTTALKFQVSLVVNFCSHFPFKRINLFKVELVIVNLMIFMAKVALNFNV